MPINPPATSLHAALALKVDAVHVCPPSIEYAAAFDPERTATNLPSKYATELQVPEVGKATAFHVSPASDDQADAVPPVDTATK